MWVTTEGQIDEIGESLRPTLSRDGGRPDVAAQDLGNLDIEEMGSMQRLASPEKDAAHAWRSRSLEENLKNRGSVNDDQWFFFLSARTAIAGAGRGRTGWRPARRFRISSKVGRSRELRSSRRR